MALVCPALAWQDGPSSSYSPTPHSGAGIAAAGTLGAGCQCEDRVSYAEGVQRQLQRSFGEVGVGQETRRVPLKQEQV